MKCFLYFVVCILFFAISSFRISVNLSNVYWLFIQNTCICILQTKNKTLSFSFLLNMTLCWTIPMFGRRHKPGSLRVWRQQQAGVSLPFVTSQGVQHVKWSRANRRIKGYFSSLTGFCTIWDLFKNQTRRALIGSRIKKKNHIKNGSFALLPV